MFEATLPEFIGITGAIIYLLSYAAVQWRRDFVRTIKYSLMNLTAASFVLYSLSTNWNTASAIIQISWIIISVYGVYRCMKYLAKGKEASKKAPFPFVKNKTN